MDASEQAAEQIVRMTLAGSEMAIRLTGAASKNVAAALMAAAAGNERTKGKTRLASMLKSGKELKVFQLRQDDLKKFAAEAKRYGVLYTVIKPEAKDAPKLDIMVRAEDAAKINRILEKMGYGRVGERQDTDVACDVEDPQRETAADKPSKTDADHAQSNMDALAEILGAPTEKEANEYLDPLTKGPVQKAPSGPTSESSTRSDGAFEKTPDGRVRRSVQRDIDELRRQRRTKATETQTLKVPERQAAPHKPAAQKTKTRSKER